MIRNVIFNSRIINAGQNILLTVIRKTIIYSPLILISCSPKTVVTKRFLPNTDVTDLHNYKSVQFRDKIQDSTLNLVVSISGGGSRSSNFAKGVLLELEEIKINSNSNVLHEIDCFSTVSGGGHAAGAYLASLFQYNQKTHNENDIYWKSYEPAMLFPMRIF